MQFYKKIPESADVYFAGDLYFQVAAVPFPASINLSFHLAFCFFFFSQAKICSSWFLSELWHLWSASFRSDWSCKQQVLCQAACPHHSCACLNSFAAGRHLGRVVAMCICCLLHCTSLPVKASSLCLHPNTLGREFLSPAVLYVTFG